VGGRLVPRGEGAPAEARYGAFVSRSRIVAAGLALVAFVITLGSLKRGEGNDLDAVGVLLAALATLPLAAWRRGPLAVFALTAAASAVTNALAYPLGPPVGPTIALFFVGLAGSEERSERRRTAAVVIGLFTAHIAGDAIGHDRLPFPELLFGSVIWTGAWLAGERTRLRHQRRADLEERAVADERTRIARDLHDSVGHAINVILVQAGAARLLHERDPERSRAALETLEGVARDTIGEIDHMVRALRDEPTRAPVGLAALDGLVARHREAGLSVAVEVSGETKMLPPAVDQAAFRILQEALTNAARHGSGDVEVELAYGARALEIDVANPAAGGATPTSGGLGLVGMRERAELLGGSLETESKDGRFVVRARLPYGGRG
jgi:signal transduction histidine kinase